MPQEQPGSYRGGEYAVEIKCKCHYWRKPEYPEEKERKNCYARSKTNRIHSLTLRDSTKNCRNLIYDRRYPKNALKM